ncbi:MAG: hypothetical protein RLZZ611_2385 [Cyanobacteriota bacterium]|jgi:hypothetical protein
MMELQAELLRLRGLLLQQPGDGSCWQELIACIEALGGGLLLADLDDLFEQPLRVAAVTAEAQRTALIEQGLEAHRAGDADGVQRALISLQNVEADGAWVHGFQGLHAELVGASGYACFRRALERDPDSDWFRYWASTAALRRRDWIDFAWLALPLARSSTLQHQLMVLAAVHHLIAGALVRLCPVLCLGNDLRVFDLVHPDRIPQDRDELATILLRYLAKERRKMVRCLLTYSQNEPAEVEQRWLQIHQLVELLRWRIPGLAEPTFSVDLYAALQRQLGVMSDRSRQDTGLATLLPVRPDLVFSEQHIQVWCDFKLSIVFSS